jgi:hypothetical protein
MPITSTTLESLLRSKPFRSIAVFAIVLWIQLSAANGILGQTPDSSNVDVPQSSLGSNETAGENNGLNNSIDQQTKPAFAPNRVKSINDRIKLLSSLIEAEKKAAEANTQTPDDQARLKPEVELKKPPAAVAPMPSQDNSNRGQDPLTETPEQSQSMKPKITLVGAKISEPVNTLELGYSLYMTRNYRAAEKNFALLLSLKPEPSEAAWLHCMIGCCQSLQNRWTESDASYRKCTNQRQAPPFAAKYADWKLRYLSERSKANQSFKGIETEFKSITTGN